jgi:glutamine amidotransferase
VFARLLATWRCIGFVIDVIDYRAGNSPSVVYALERLGLSCRLVAEPEEVLGSERLILPGVGAARATLESLAESDLVAPLTQRVQSDRVPFLGICIGLQVLFDHSEEEDTECLGWLRGAVRRFPDTERVPQIGWNEVRFDQPHPLRDGMPDAGHFYFVNSYYADPGDAGCVLGRSEYGPEFCSVVAHDNIVATQFHAEKSGPLGMRLLTNFARWTP